MAVSAAHVALVDLGPENQCVAGVNEPTNSGQFQRRVAMIELQNDWIGLSAIDAWMSRQVLGDDCAIPRAVAGAAISRAIEVVRDVLSVVLFPVLATARPAVRAVRPAGGVLDREFAEWLSDRAARADPKSCGIGHRNTRNRGCGALIRADLSLEHLF